MPEDYMLKEAIEAVRQGHRTRARDLLTRLLRADQSNPTYWLWMSSVVETAREQVYCLQTVLRHDPQNSSARRGLVLIGALPADAEVRPQPPVRRKWQVAVQKEPPQGLRALWASPVVRVTFVAVVFLVLTGLVLAGVFGVGNRPRRVALRPTRTPGPPPTFTLTPTYIASTPVVKNITPTPPITGPTPLWMLLEATYTPTPVYVNTPHPVSEDYRIGQRAFGRGDWATALRHFKNASQVNPGAADIQYLIGEAERMMGDYRAALESYNRALEMAPAFAPAFLGRARASLALDADADFTEDLNKAIEYDPGFAEARLVRAGYALESGDLESAQADLDVAEQVIPDSPMVAYYRAQAALLSGDREAALEYARRAYDLDRTLLPAYRLLGEMALANGEFATSKQVLEVYLQYAEDDARGWMALGQAYMEIAGPEQAYEDLVQAVLKKNVEAALQAFDRALDLDDKLPGVYLYRAVTYLALDEGQKAVNDLMGARRLDASSFPVNLGLGRALLLAERYDDAIAQMDSCENLADGDAQVAAVRYWRARAMEAGGNAIAAAPDWVAPLELPEEAVPLSWRRMAEEHLAALTPTPTETATITLTPTPTLRPTRTVTSTPTRKPSPAVTASPTRRPTRTATVTPTP